MNTYISSTAIHNSCIRAEQAKTDLLVTVNETP